MSSLYAAQRELKALDKNIDTLIGLMTGTEKTKYSGTFDQMRKCIKKSNQFIEMYCDDNEIEDDGFGENSSNLPKIQNQYDEMLLNDVIELFGLLQTKSPTKANSLLAEFKNKLKA